MTQVEHTQAAPSIAGLKPRTRPPHFSGREPFGPLPERLQGLVEETRRRAREPMVGITVDGLARQGLFPLKSTGVSNRALVVAARALLAGLNADQRAAASFGVDDDNAWRSWSNISPYLMRHGVLLERLSEAQRELATGLIGETLSAAGFQLARDVMRLNHHIGELTGRWQEYGEWVYWISVLGTPSETEPWGWQIDGHHLIVNCLVLGDQMVVTPQFMGSEPVLAESGQFAGTRVFESEEALGFGFMLGLDPNQQAHATVGTKLPFDAITVAPRDDLVLPYEGIAFAALSEPQQRTLQELIDIYLQRLRPGHADAKREEVLRHLDETYFAWIGEPPQEGRPFYYRVHSPVVLIEFDHQPGIALDNDEPSRNHIHTLVRTPNGNDYGKDLLRQHYAHFHAQGADGWGTQPSHS